MLLKRSFRCTLIILAALALCATRCGRSREESVVLARAGDREITREQFVSRCELAVRPQVRGTQEEQKKALLELLIDEKLLALEAEANGLHRDDRLREAVSLCADFAAARALYTREVAAKVHLTPEEVAAAAEKMAQTRTVQFFLTRNQAEAESVRQQLLASRSFAQALSARGTIAVDTSRFRFTARWGDLEPTLDEAIFELNVGEISPVVKTTRGYVVCRVDSITFSPPLAETGGVDLRHKASKVLRSRKEAVRAEAYVKQVMSDKNVEVDERAFQLLSEAVLRHLELAESTLPPFAERQVLLRDEVLVPASQELSHAADMVLLRFAGGQWSIADVLNRWRVLRPPIATSSPNACRSSMARVLSTMVRDHFLAEEARRKGIYKSAQVKEETAMWRDHFLAELMLQRLRANPGADFSLRRHLYQLRRRFPVEQNLKPLQSITLTRLQLVGVRPGQYGTLAVPPWPALPEDGEQ
ncbi:MAG: peptidyl-prolyl cis-trans isomerase [candidate division KSB1 bacterium]|nr:peptidyl-prolyl cis-trans isomerase [candidate division KSB1 bacterium]